MDPGDPKYGRMIETRHLYGHTSLNEGEVVRILGQIDDVYEIEFTDYRGESREWTVETQFIEIIE